MSVFIKSAIVQILFRSDRMKGGVDNSGIQ